MSDKLLEIQNLAVQYVTDDQTVHAVNGIDLTIHKGEALGLVGETGAGKTTTALAVLRLLPRYTGKIPHGKILFNGEDLLAADENAMRKIRGAHISMIFQDPMTSLNPVLTVGYQIGEVIALHNENIPRGELTKKVGQILETVGIPAERQNEYPHQFSGGMKQRVMIAIAIACSPALLIADEPTTALDVTIQAQVLKMMRSLRRKYQSAVLLITHDLGIVANFCDSVAIMYAGEIAERGTLEDIFDKQKPHHPYTEGLFGSIPSLEINTGRLNPISGLMPDPADLPPGCKFHPRCPKCLDICKTAAPVSAAREQHRIKCHLLSANTAGTGGEAVGRNTA